MPSACRWRRIAAIYWSPAWRCNGVATSPGSSPRRGGCCVQAACWRSVACVLAPRDELQASWQAVDGHVHVNRFRALSTYQHLCAGSGLQVRALQVQPQVLHYPDVRTLTGELKALGAHNLNPGRPGGLTGCVSVFAPCSIAYEGFRQPQGAAGHPSGGVCRAGKGAGDEAAFFVTVPIPM